MDIARRIYVTVIGLSDNQALENNNQNDIVKNHIAEISAMPVLFPESARHLTRKESLTDYVKMRFFAACNAFTSYAPYLLIMYMLMRASQQATNKASTSTRIHYVLIVLKMPHGISAFFP